MWKTKVDHHHNNNTIREYTVVWIKSYGGSLVQYFLVSGAKEKKVQEKKNNTLSSKQQTGCIEH